MLNLCTKIRPYSERHYSVSRVKGAAMGPVDSDESALPSFVRCAAVLLLISGCGSLCLAQGNPPHMHPPSVAMLAVPRVQVPDVRGRRREDAQATLRRAGLKPGTTSTSPGPGIV